MFRSLLIAAVSAAVLGCALASCGGGGGAGSGETLRWKTAVDVPVNFSMKVGNDLSYAELFPEVDCDELTNKFPGSFIDKECEEWNSLDSGYIFDLGSGTIPTTSDVMDILRKLDSTKIQYSITATNNTKIPLTFFGMLFPNKDTASMMDTVKVFYDSIVRMDDTIGGRINIFGKTGLHVESKRTESYPLGGLSDEKQGKRLGDLIIHQKAFSYRWLVKLDDISGLKDTAKTEEFVDIKIRIRFSGVNSVDSLYDAF